MDPLSLLIIASSFGAKYYADQQAQDRQQALANAMRNYQQIKARNTEQAINNLVSQQTPTARTTDMNQAIADRVASSNNLVSQVAASNPSQIEGKLSNDYKQSQASTADSVAAKTKRAIEQLATMGAPGDVQSQFGIRFGRAAGNVDANNAAIDRVGQAYRTDISNVRPDPLLSTLGDVGLAVGGAMGAPAAASGAGAGAETAFTGMSVPGARLAVPWTTRLQQGLASWGLK